MVWWIASWAEDELVQGKNSLLTRGVLVLQWDCVDEDDLSLDQFTLLWWLVLFIEALVLFPNIEREGSQQRRANLKGDS